MFLEGIPNAVPQNWYVNACRLVVNDEVPSLDSAEARVLPRSEPIPTIKVLRGAIVSGRYETGPIAAMMATLSDSDAIDLALGADRLTSTCGNQSWTPEPLA